MEGNIDCNMPYLQPYNVDHDNSKSHKIWTNTHDLNIMRFV